MAEGRDISDALREAVDRTVQATVDTRGRAQAAADDLAESVDEIVKGAGEGITARRRSVREAVGKSLPATQEDIRALRDEIKVLTRRLDALEKGPAKARPKAKPKASPKAKPKSRSAPKSKPRSGGGSGSRS